MLCRNTDSTCGSSKGITGHISKPCVSSKMAFIFGFPASGLVLKENYEVNTFSSDPTGLVYFRT